MSETRYLQMRVCGDFITDLAREKYHNEHNLLKAMEILMGATETDQLTETEHIELCLEILSGKKSIVGTYPGDDYDVKDNDPDNEENSLYSFLETVQKDLDRIKDAESKLNEMIQKYCFVIERLPDYKIRELDQEYKSETGVHLFQTDDTDVKLLSQVNERLDVLNDRLEENIRLQNVENSLVDSFLKRQHYSEELQDEDYGWLEPDGTFHPVKWGDHWQWASDWLNENRPVEKYPELYGKTKEERLHKQLSKPGDVLIYNLHWLLIHSPSLGTATVTKSDLPLTKAQKEFLYDYYIKRDMHKEANALYADD